MGLAVFRVERLARPNVLIGARHVEKERIAAKRPTRNQRDYEFVSFSSSGWPNGDVALVSAEKLIHRKARDGVSANHIFVPFASPRAE
jgi:hypothetical protein